MLTKLLLLRTYRRRFLKKKKIQNPYDSRIQKGLTHPGYEPRENAVLIEYLVISREKGDEEAKESSVGKQTQK